MSSQVNSCLLGDYLVIISAQAIIEEVAMDYQRGVIQAAQSIENLVHTDFRQAHWVRTREIIYPGLSE